jgi:hypothetical protein
VVVEPERGRGGRSAPPSRRGAERKGEAREGEGGEGGSYCLFRLPYSRRASRPVDVVLTPPGAPHPVPRVRFRRGL